MLAKNEILKFLKSETAEDRLIISPLLDIEDQVSSTSIDLRLGNRFVICKRTRLPALDIAAHDQIKSQVRLYHEEVYLRYGQPFVLHPGGLVLGSTLEYLRLPGMLCGDLKSRSTWARLGLSILTAPHISPNFRGTITLELTNIGSMPIVLYPCIRIAHLVLNQISHVPEEDCTASRYGLSTGPVIASLDGEDFPLINLPPRQIIIGITGGMGSLAKAMADDLVRHYGFVSFSLSHIVRRENRRRGREMTGSNLRRTGNSLRESRGEDYLVDRTLNRIRSEVRSRLVVVEGIRHPEEIVRLLRVPDAFIIGVDAVATTRFDRLKERMELSDWDSTPTVDNFKEFDDKDMGIGEPEYGQRIRDCLEKVEGLSPQGKGFSLENTNMDMSEIHDWLSRTIRTIEQVTGLRILSSNTE